MAFQRSAFQPSAFQVASENVLFVSGTLPRLAASISLSQVIAANAGDYTASAIIASDARYAATVSQPSRFGAIIAQTFTYRGGVR